MKKRVTWVIVCLILAVSLVGGGYALIAGAHPASKTNAQQQVNYSVQAPVSTPNPHRHTGAQE